MSRGLLPLVALVVSAALVNAAVACSTFGSDATGTTDADGAPNGSDAIAVDGIVADGNDGNDGADARSSTCPPAGDAGANCPEGGVVWNGRCYFVIGTLQSRAAAANTCRQEQAELATFTCPAEWSVAGGIGPSNYWLGAMFDGKVWTWSSGEPFTYFPPGGSFDASPPADPSNVCLWRDQYGTWHPEPCGATSAGAYCERH